MTQDIAQRVAALAPELEVYLQRYQDIAERIAALAPELEVYLQRYQDIAERIAALAPEIEMHLQRYHILAAPTISDQEFDRLIAELQDREEALAALVPKLEERCRHFQLYQDITTPTNQKFDRLLAELQALREMPLDSPTQRVGGAPTSDFPTVRHARPMLSLDNSYSRQDVEDFDRRVRQSLPDEEVEYVFELKIDGVALSLIYQDSLLVRAVTRGDGVQGDEITANARTIPTIPLRLQQPGINCENPRRGLYGKKRLRPIQDRRRAAFCQPAQFHGRLAQAAKSQHSGQAQPAIFRLLDTRRRRHPDAPQRMP